MKLHKANKSKDKFIITEVWKTGEKVAKTYRGRKPQGYMVYKNGLHFTFLPYGK